MCFDNVDEVLTRAACNVRVDVAEVRETLYKLFLIAGDCVDESARKCITEMLGLELGGNHNEEAK